VVFFGDGIAPDCALEAARRIDQADALLVIGSSLMVFSGYRFCRTAAACGKPVAALNLGKTRADDMLSLKVEGAAEQILPALLAQLN
jgi:NAD-dependent SIR2 family protein deacetylase